MALGTDHVTLTQVTAASRTRSNSAFVPELWADEVIASYKANLVMPQLSVIMNHVGKKGDTIHVPRPVRDTPSAKLAETQVTLIANQETSTPYIIDQHWEYSRLIEDIVSVQADPAFRRFYTDDAGYALAKKVDSDIHARGAGFAGADAAPTVAGTNYSKAVIGTPSGGSLVAWNSATTGNGSVLTDEGIRLAIQALDDSDVPSMGRVLVIPPVEKKNLLGVARFTEQAFVGETGAGNSIRNGYVGNVYGVEVYVSTNCATVASADTTPYRAALMFQKEGLLLIEQLRPRTQTQYKQEWLADLFTADTIYGTGLLRPEAGVAIIVPA
jgi:hypothetical protein